MKLTFRIQWFEGKKIVLTQDTPPIEFDTPLDATRAVLELMSRASRVNYAAACGTGPRIPMPHRDEGFGADTTIVISQITEET